MSEVAEAPEALRSGARLRLRLVLVLAAAMLLPAGAAVLYSFPPTEYGFYPRCLFHAVTGLHCPGCGATRCLHALLHADLAQALAYNALFVLMLPLLLVGAGAMAYSAWTGRPLFRRTLPAGAIWAFLVVMIAYWVLRNIDVYPLTLLAPHGL